MTRFQRWVFKKILKQELKQGGHVLNLINIHDLIITAWVEEFSEDNIPTHKAMLAYCQKEALNSAFFEKDT